MTQVKICGVKRTEDALAAADAGATMLGFVFAPSRRRIEPEQAAAIIAKVRRRVNVRTAGIFVNEDPEEMNRLADLCDLDYLQLSGDEAPETGEALRRPAIKAVHVKGGETRESVDARVRRVSAPIVLLDTAAAGAYGGTGETFDWAAIPALDRPVLLAGGLHAGNVAEAIRIVRPWGVDVSSGVETNGEKDQAKIREFVKRALKEGPGATGGSICL
jgi:phosphoribosylanthranilate isomerase